MAKWLDNLKHRVDGRMEQLATPDPSGEGVAPHLTDTGRPGRWAKNAMWLGLVAAIVWACFAPLGQGVPAHGFVKVDGNRKTIQHLRGGVVEALLVRDGDRVELNQPLIKLNEAQAQAQQGSIDSQLQNLLAVEARLNAERISAAEIVFPEFLLQRKDLPQVREFMDVQTQLFRTRKTTLSGEISINQQTISGLDSQIKGLMAQQASADQQLALYREELASLKPMFEQGFVPRNRIFELERAVAYIVGQRSDYQATIERARSQISELRLKTLQVTALYRKEVETQLTDVQRQVGDLKERRVATADDLERVILRAPSAGTVVEMSVFTVGGVIAPGQKLMDIVPLDSKLVVEVMIPPHLIDNIRVGLDADVHFTALDQSEVPPVVGKLVYIGADRQTDPRTDQSYFVGRIEMPPAALKVLGKHKLQPGMPADAVIKTGERTLASYLLRPLLTRMQFSMTER